MKSKLSFSIISFSAFFALFFILGVAPANAATIRLTHNTYDDLTPHISNGKVVWEGFSGGTNNAEIYLYDAITGTTSQITSNTIRDENPQIDNGKIVWEEYSGTGGTSEIYLYDIATGTKTQITNNTTNDNTSDISVSDGKIVWKGWKGGNSTDQEIYMYDIATGSTTQITNNNFIDHNPRISDGKVVWESYDGRDYEIYIYDISTGNTSQITNNSVDDANPQVSQNRIVWESNNGNGPVIMLYDITSGITTQLGSGSTPAINGDKVVWQGHDSHNDQIYLYDIGTGTTSQVSYPGNNYRAPDIDSNGEMVWEGWNGHDWEIYYRNSAEEIPQISNLSGGTINAGDTYSENGSFFDPDSFSWTATVDYDDGSGNQPLTLNSDNTFSLSHQYNSIGSYQITVNITDNQGSTGSGYATVNVTGNFTPTADSYIATGSGNKNEGASTSLRVQNSGNNRVLAKFDQSQIQSAIGDATNYTAKLQFAITDNGNNWGNHGRSIEVHRLTQDWVEGNGFVTDNPTPDRGTGPGVTWNCAVDSNIHNTQPNCSGSSAWDMTTSSLWPFASAVTASTTITNNQSGTVSFDVTSDVQSFLSGTNQNDGWLLKKTDEATPGRINFGSKESGNGPQLIITKN